MRAVSLLVGVLMVSGLLRAKAPVAESWQLTSGETLEARLAEVYGPAALFVTPKGSRFVSLENLAPPELDRVAAFLEKRARSAGTWSASTSPLLKALEGRLQVVRDGKPVSFDPGSRPEPRLILLYYSAHWCGPCRRFTPTLVETYNRLGEAYPGVFELVFVSSDESTADQVRYARESGMSWPMIRWSYSDQIALVNRWRGSGIPCLVVLTRDGDLIYHSYEAGEYVGPGEPLRRLERLLGLLDERNPETRLVRHPLAVRQHVLAAAGKDRPAASYLTPLDPSRFNSLAGQTIVAEIRIDDQGRVLGLTTKPSMDVIPARNLQAVVERWLFLPHVIEGRPQPGRVRLTLDFQQPVGTPGDSS
jgi:thiol-disulfide isomerase/thioredoxin